MADDVTSNGDLVADTESESAEEELDESMADALDALGDVLDRPAVHRAIDAFKRRIASQHELTKLKLEAEKDLRLQQLKLAGSNRYFAILAFVVGLGTLVFVMWLFRDKEQVLIPIVTATIGLLGGATGARALTSPRS